MIAEQQLQVMHLPSEWCSERLKDVATLRDQKVRTESNTRDYIELEDIEGGTGRIINRRDTLDVVSAVTLFYKGDILFGKLRPYLEKYSRPDFDGKCTGEILAIRPDRIHGPYLFYCFASRWFIGRCTALAYGAKMPRVDWATQLSQFVVPLPPLQEQRYIAKFLDQSCEAIDKAISTKREQLLVLDGVKRDAIQNAVTRGIAKPPALRATANAWMPYVPKNWNLVGLKRVAEIQSGLTLGKEYDGPLIERPYLRVANVQDGHLDLTEVTTIEVPLAVAQRVSLRAGDVLMTEGGDLDKLGRGTLWTAEVPDCLHQNHIFAVRCFGHKLMPAFLAYLTASQYGRDYFEATGKRTTNLAATNSTKVGQFPIPLPPLSEQRAICAHLEDKLTHLRQVVDCIQGQIGVLTDYRKSLIHEYVTGQRRVRADQTWKALAHG